MGTRAANCWQFQAIAVGVEVVVVVVGRAAVWQFACCYHSLSSACIVCACLGKSFCHCRAMGNVNKAEAKHGKELFRWVQEIGKVIYCKTVADQQEFVALVRIIVLN